MELNLILGNQRAGSSVRRVYLTRNVMKRDTGTSEDAGDFGRHQGGRGSIPAQAVQDDHVSGGRPGLPDLHPVCVRAHATIPTIPATPAQLALWTTISFVLGAACSVAAGYMGMWVAIRANIRTAAGATKDMNSALQPALRGGAVSGFFVVAMSLLGVRRPVRDRAMRRA